MNTIIIDKTTITSVLGRAKSIASSRTTMPILASVLLHITAKGIRLTATDLEVGYETYIEAIESELEGNEYRLALPAERPWFVPADQTRDAVRDSICGEWRECLHAEICMDDKINEDCVCYRDEPDKIPTDSRRPLYRDELKVMAAGFLLVKYIREEKKLLISEADPANGWTALEPFATYAAAERKLEELKSKNFIETDLNGQIVMSGWNRPGKLKEAGFEFYRRYGDEVYQSGCCIKVGSKNWSNLAKYSNREELMKAWNKLMQDPKALEG